MTGPEERTGTPAGTPGGDRPGQGAPEPDRSPEAAPQQGQQHGPGRPGSWTVPSRPSPLPPPRPVAPGPVGADAPTQALPRPGGPGAERPAGAAPGTPLGAGPATVVPDRSAGRPAAPRPPLTAPAGRPVKGRRAHLALRRLDPWSVFVTSLLLSLFLAVVTIVASVVLYAVLDALGVPKSVNKAGGDVFDQGALLTRGRFIGGAALLAAADVVLLTAFATLGSLLYNLCATFTGGVEVTLAERQ